MHTARAIDSKFRVSVGRFLSALVSPSAHIEQADQRRQAGLLSAFLLLMIVLAAVPELLTLALLQDQGYTGYRTTIAVAAALAAIYVISRTRYFRLAAILAVIVASVAIFGAALADPSWALAGLFDYLIVTLWLGSLYLSVGPLVGLIIASLAGLLLIPLLIPSISVGEVLIGPFSFVLVTSALLLVTTRHRNQLEQDRRVELAENEQRSRQEAARAQALLRVAGRLNAQLDLETLVQSLSEEVAQALGTPVAIVTLYDEKRGHLYPAAGVGLTADQIHGLPPLERDLHDQAAKLLGPVFAIPNLQEVSGPAHLEAFKQLDMRSIASATMEYDQSLIGSLTAITLGEPREFSAETLLLLRGLADQAALAIINTRLYKDAHRRLENLQALRAIDVSIARNHDLRQTLEVLLDKITAQLRVDAAVILLLDEIGQLLEYGSSRGFQSPALRYTRLRIGEGNAGRAAQQGQTIRIEDLRADPETLASSPSLAQEGFVAYYAAPLITQGHVKGVLEVFHRSRLDPDQEWLDFLEALAGQAAIAIESTTLFEDLQKTNDELSRAYDSTIEGWSHALDLRDKETEGHTRRVTEMTLELARAVGVAEADLVHIRRGGLLHDIGKMGVPDSILLKAGPLTPEEWAIMRRHPDLAHEMLRSIDYLRPALDIPYCHHEKWDGTGYPRGLKGEAIPRAARIFAVADVWDALTSDRPYRRAWPHEKAMAVIQKGAGHHFDPQIVEVFLKLT